MKPQLLTGKGIVPLKFGGELLRGMTAAWLFNGEATAVRELLSNGTRHSGTLTGSPRLNYGSPEIGAGLLLDGVDDEVALGAWSGLGADGGTANNFSIALRLVFRSLPVNGVYAGRVGSGSWAAGWGVYRSAGGLDFWVGNQANYARIAGSAVNTAYTLVGTFNGAAGAAAKIELYRNGAAAPTKAEGAAFAATTNPVKIGGNLSAGGGFASAVIQYLLLWNRVLSAAEAAAIHNDPLGWLRIGR